MITAKLSIGFLEGDLPMVSVRKKIEMPIVDLLYDGIKYETIAVFGNPKEISKNVYEYSLTKIKRKLIRYN